VRGVLSQSETGQTSHQVQLPQPGVPDLHWIDAHAFLSDHDMLRCDALAE
jgi:hypothetical protein